MDTFIGILLILVFFTPLMVAIYLDKQDDRKREKWIKDREDRYNRFKECNFDGINPSETLMFYRKYEDEKDEKRRIARLTADMVQIQTAMLLERFGKDIDEENTVPAGELQDVADKDNDIHCPLVDTTTPR